MSNPASPSKIGSTEYAVNKRIADAYTFCKNIARNHYENFPVASFLLPKRIRNSIAVIYAFARTADDIADEGNFTTEERLSQLAQFKLQLDNINPHHTDKRAAHSLEKENAPDNPIFLALSEVIQNHELPIELFYDLLEAFKQDITSYEYFTFQDVLTYCRHSANPIGRLLLHLNKQATPENVLLSDHICTGLQLINFMQDLKSDLLERNRCYIPLEDLLQFGVTKTELQSQLPNPQIQNLITFQLQRIQNLYDMGKPLGNTLKGLFGLEIRMIISGGQCILNQLKIRKNIFARPKLNTITMLRMFWHAFPIGKMDANKN